MNEHLRFFPQTNPHDKQLMSSTIFQSKIIHQEHSTINSDTSVTQSICGKLDCKLLYPSTYSKKKTLHYQ